jgi:hypothetical protein
MKSHRFMLSIAVVTLVTAAAFAQNHADTQKEPAAQSDAHKSVENPAPSDAQKSFDQLKTLAGTWAGNLTTDPKDPEMEGTHPQVTLRVTSRGNAIVHEMKEAGMPDDPAKYDHPVTMLYVDSGRLTLVHYCDAGNRPRMTAKVSPDGKKVEFEFLDLSGGNEYGHMHHSVFTIIDANHHTEDWTYMMPGDKPMHAHMDLQRTK